MIRLRLTADWSNPHTCIYEESDEASTLFGRFGCRRPEAPSDDDVDVGVCQHLGNLLDPFQPLLPFRSMAAPGNRISLTRAADVTRELKKF